jgi:hypothetical protein
MNNYTDLVIASRTEAPRRRRGRAALRIIYRNADRSKWVRFSNPEKALTRFLMLQEYERTSTNRAS